MKFNEILFFILSFIALSLIVISGERTALLLYILTISLYLIYRILSNKKTFFIIIITYFFISIFT